MVLAFDGDGDRVGLVTEKGNVVFPDKIMMLLAKDVLAKNRGGQIIFDVKCSNSSCRNHHRQMVENLLCLQLGIFI